MTRSEVNGQVANVQFCCPSYEITIGVNVAYFPSPKRLFVEFASLAYLTLVWLRESAEKRICWQRRVLLHFFA